MLVQLHGQKTRPATANQQSAHDGCIVSLQETDRSEDYRSERIWRLMQADPIVRHGLRRAGLSGWL